MVSEPTMAANVKGKPMSTIDADFTPNLTSTRKVIQLVEWGNWLIALCDDGTMWGFQTNGTQWVQMASIPNN